MKRKQIVQRKVPHDYGIFHQQQFLDATKDQKIESAFYVYAKIVLYCTLTFVALELLKHFLRG